MTAHNQVAISLDQFDKSNKMLEIMDLLKLSKTLGHDYRVFSFEDLGTSREAIFIITLLKIKGYVVDLGNDEIIVREVG